MLVEFSSKYLSSLPSDQSQLPPHTPSFEEKLYTFTAHMMKNCILFIVFILISVSTILNSLGFVSER